MIEETVRYSCRSCGSTNIIRNGTNKCGNPQYHCRGCGVYRVLRPKERYTSEQKAQILRAYRERMSLRGLQRVFGVWRGTVLRWLERYVQQLPSLTESLLPAQADDVLEMDELVSFVAEKWFKRWLWTAQCRRTRQIVAYAIGDRSEATGHCCGKRCQLLTKPVPATPTIGWLIPCFCHLPSTSHPARPVASPLTRSAGTTPCVNGWDAIPASPCLFLRRIAILISLPIGSFLNIT